MNWFPPTFDSAEWLPGSPLVPSVGGSGCPSGCCQTGALSEIHAPLLLGCSHCFCYAKMRNSSVSVMLFRPSLKVWLRLSSVAREPAGSEPGAILLNFSKKLVSCVCSWVRRGIGPGSHQTSWSYLVVVTDLASQSYPSGSGEAVFYVQTRPGITVSYQWMIVANIIACWYYGRGLSWSATYSHGGKD